MSNNALNQSPTPEPVGAPQVQVILPDKLGGQKVEEVQVDSNRLSPISEQRLLWVDSLAIPARAEDILLQSAVWISGSAFACSILRSLPPVVELLGPIVSLILVAVGVAVYVWNHFKHLRGFIVYRAVLVALGFGMGVIL